MAKRKNKKISIEQREEFEDERMFAILEMIEDYLTTVDDEIYWKRKEAALKIMTHAAIFGGDTIYESVGILDMAKDRYKEIVLSEDTDEENENNNENNDYE